MIGTRLTIAVSIVAGAAAWSCGDNIRPAQCPDIEPTAYACTSHRDCIGDRYCDPSTKACRPWQAGSSDPQCSRDLVPGVFQPRTQCEWLGPPPNDPFADHRNVLATPMVATFAPTDAGVSPSIVFTTYNANDGGADACRGDTPAHFGVVRIVDGRTCEQQATIAAVPVIGSASVAIADLGGDDATPEIVAARQGGGLVAFTLRAGQWVVLWQTQSTFGSTLCNWGGPSIHDLDDDGAAEIIFYGAVYAGGTGATIDESLGSVVDAIGTGYIPVVADLDADGVPELVTGARLYRWDKKLRKWLTKQSLPFASGHVAVADFGTFPEDGRDARAMLDGVAEIVVAHRGIAKVFNVFGREIFSANLIAIPDGAEIGSGGPPTIADFDGDGRVEFALAGGTAYHVFDLDCRNSPESASCPSLRTDGLAWARQSQDSTSNKTGSSVFDFDGDSRAEAVYGDECFTRVYDGVTGAVIFSRYRRSCTWYENPIVADVDADFNAEIVSTSNTSCDDFTCPAIDPIFDGLSCLRDSDCPGSVGCLRDDPSERLGRCRCGSDDDCGGDGFVCSEPIAGPSPQGNVCRAAHPPATQQAGIHVLSDSLDRWVSTRRVWNQHAYSVTNIDEQGRVPRTSEWLSNWTQSGLNNFRQNSPGESVIVTAVPDLTVRQPATACETGDLVVRAEVCNRGAEPVAAGLPVTVYAAEPREPRCTTETTSQLDPGACAEVSCRWSGPPGAGIVVVDDRGDGGGIGTECIETNNGVSFCAACP